MDASSCALEAVAVVQHRNRPHTQPEGWTIGLLTRAPSPEGGRFEEAVADRYARQPLQVIPTSSNAQAFRNEERITFGPIADEWPQVTHAAVFVGDEVRAYGRLHRVHGNAPQGCITFAPQAVQVRLQ